MADPLSEVILTSGECGISGKKRKEEKKAKTLLPSP